LKNVSLTTPWIERAHQYACRKMGPVPEYDALGIIERNLMRTNKKKKNEWILCPKYFGEDLNHRRCLKTLGLPFITIITFPTIKSYSKFTLMKFYVPLGPNYFYVPLGLSGGKKRTKFFFGFFPNQADEIKLPTPY